MNGNTRDHRPKVISFRSRLDGMEIAAKQDILWPCHAFNISLPQKKKNFLNVFEVTILKLTETEFGDTNKIVEITCLEKELVVFIQSRLSQLGLLSSRYELSKEGKALLDSWNDEENNVEYVKATVFVDLHSGKLLPYVIVGTLQKEIISFINGPLCGIKFGPTGKSKSVVCLKINPDKDSYWKVSPNPTNIIRAIREFKKKHNRHAFLSKSSDLRPPSIPVAEAITISSQPELIYLHCEALIQKGNPDLLVTDGCGLGFSEGFVRYLNEMDLEWVTELKQKGVKQQSGYSDGSFNTTPNRSFKYREISLRLRRSESSLDRSKKLKPDSSSYEYYKKQRIESGIKNLYESLEWSLRQVITDYPVPEWEQVFSSQNFKENEALLHGFANKIGFSITEKNKWLLQVKQGAIRQIDKGSVELQPLLAMALAGASSNSIHPFHKLASEHPEFISHALDLKRLRDPIEHGNATKLDIGEEALEKLLEKTVLIITSLLPDVALDLGKSEISEARNDVNQSRLKAEICLEEVMGTAFLYHTKSEIKEQLVRAEIMIEQYDQGLFIEIIKCYASVVQHVLFEVTRDRRLSNSQSEKLKEDAIDRIIKFSSYSISSDIPEQVRTVNVQRLARAVQGSNSTLGGNLLAVFLLASEDELKQLQTSCAEVIDIIANLIRLRGHGNQQRLDFSRDDIRSLRGNIFKAIKIISGVF